MVFQTGSTMKGKATGSERKRQALEEQLNHLVVIYFIIKTSPKAVKLSKKRWQPVSSPCGRHKPQTGQSPTVLGEAKLQDIVLLGHRPHEDADLRILEGLAVRF